MTLKTQYKMLDVPHAVSFDNSSMLDSINAMKSTIQQITALKASTPDFNLLKAATLSYSNPIVSMSSAMQQFADLKISIPDFSLLKATTLSYSNPIASMSSAMQQFADLTASIQKLTQFNSFARQQRFQSIPEQLSSDFSSTVLNLLDEIDDYDYACPSECVNTKNLIKPVLSREKPLSLEQFMKITMFIMSTITFIIYVISSIKKLTSNENDEIINLLNRHFTKIESTTNQLNEYLSNAESDVNKSNEYLSNIENH